MEDKIKCEYCGALFDYEDYDNCPYCGASLADNAEAREIIEQNRKIEKEKLELKKSELNLKQQELNLEHYGKMLDSAAKLREHSYKVKKENARQGRRIVRRFFGYVFIVVLGLTLIGGYVFYRAGVNDFDWKGYIEEIRNEKTEPVTASTEYANLGENVKREYCEFKVNRVRKYKKVSGETIKNNMAVFAVDVWVKNTGKLNRSLDDFKVFYYDSYNNQCYCRAHTPNSAERKNALGAIYLESGISVSGSLFYEIPPEISEAYVEFESTVIKLSDISKYVK